MAKLLLDGGADVDQANNNGATPLLISSQQGHQGVMTLLLAKSAKVDRARSSGATALFMGSKNGHQEAVKLLLAKGATVDQTSKSGATPLLTSSRNGYQAIVKLLLKSGADVNHARSNGDTALSLAVHKGHTAVASLIRHWSLTISRRLTTYACVLRAIDLEEGRATQGEPVTKLLQRLARTPDDIVRVIVMFVGDGGDAEEKLRLEKLARGEGAEYERREGGKAIIGKSRTC